MWYRVGLGVPCVMCGCESIRQLDLNESAAAVTRADCLQGLPPFVLQPCTLRGTTHMAVCWPDAHPST
jgi:hypothetical protein